MSAPRGFSWTRDASDDDDYESESEEEQQQHNDDNSAKRKAPDTAVEEPPAQKEAKNEVESPAEVNGKNGAEQTPSIQVDVTPQQFTQTKPIQLDFNALISSYTPSQPPQPPRVMSVLKIYNHTQTHMDAGPYSIVLAPILHPNRLLRQSHPSIISDI